MYLWRRQASPEWWRAHELAVSGRANVAVIERPNRKRVQIECASESRSALLDLQKQFGGRVTKWPKNWLQRALRQRTRPIRVGRRQLIIPAGAAFGTGEHPTTAMCLKMLERVLDGRDGSPSRPTVGDGAEKRPSRVLDLGTGSGILALAASLLGAQNVIAIDNDPVAIRTAEQNAKRNKLRQIEFEVADVRRLRMSRQVDLVVANLFVEVLIEILPKIARSRRLILSGVLREQEAELTRALKRNRLELLQVRRRGKWIAVLARPAA